MSASSQDEVAMITVYELMQESGVAFGTSGARGMVTAMTDRVCYGYTKGFLRFMAEQGEFGIGGRVALAGDLRPSTPRILAACIKAIQDSGGIAEFCGFVPTPALALHAFAAGIPSLMVTGSHIPADRNGIKFFRPGGELMKADEPEMGRQQLTFGDDCFDGSGMIAIPEPLPPATDVEEAYVARYLNYFGRGALSGKRIGVYQHSAVGRDLLARILSDLGAETILLGRSETFVPVDTEAIRPEDITLAKHWAQADHLDSIVSTDGDSDRPLLSDELGNWLRGDVLGILCAAGVGATSVVTPVSSNTALELDGRFARCRRTRIGSPYVIAAMNEELESGASIVCGYEANGGFLLGSAIRGANDAPMLPLPTRDALLPILAILAADAPSVLAQVTALPQRFTFSDRISPFPADASQRLFARLLDGDLVARLTLQTQLFGAFADEATTMDLTDGVRTTFAGGAIIHLRASGNAPELRCYSEAASDLAAAQINRLALAAILALQ